MNREIFYVMSGPAHLPYLVASLYTLDDHWHDPVRIYAWPESVEYAHQIKDKWDWRFPLEVIEEVPTYRGKNAQFINKIQVAQTLPQGGVYLYLDADTTIHGDLSPLFRAAEIWGFCATRFSNWTTQGGLIQNRVKRLRQFSEIDQKLVETILVNFWYSVNGGVWACCPNSPVLKLWEEWTWIAKSIFIADECVLHILQAEFLAKGKMDVIRDGRFNCSTKPKWMPEGLTEDEIVIWHFHGDSNCRPDKSPKGFARWWPIYQECLKKNVGGIADWGKTIRNKYIDRVKNGS